MPLNYSSLTFDDLLRSLRDDKNPTIRMLVDRADKEIEFINIMHLEVVQEIERERDAVELRLSRLTRNIESLAESMAQGPK